MRSIDTRIQNNTLHFFVYFRSWDLWNGFPANLAAIQNLKEYMAGEIGVKDGEMVVESKGLHHMSHVFILFHFCLLVSFIYLYFNRIIHFSKINILQTEVA